MHAHFNETLYKRHICSIENPHVSVCDRFYYVKFGAEILFFVFFFVLRTGRLLRVRSNLENTGNFRLSAPLLLGFAGHVVQPFLIHIRALALNLLTRPAPAPWSRLGTGLSHKTQRWQVHRMRRSSHRNGQISPRETRSSTPEG